jgi:hypothetical protein
MQIGAKGIENIFMIIVLKKNSKNRKIKKFHSSLSIKHIWAPYCYTLLMMIVIIIIIIMFSYGFQ